MLDSSKSKRVGRQTIGEGFKRNTCLDNFFNQTVMSPRIRSL